MIKYKILFYNIINNRTCSGNDNDGNLESEKKEDPENDKFFKEELMNFKNGKDNMGNKDNLKNLDLINIKIKSQKKEII